MTEVQAGPLTFADVASALTNLDPAQPGRVVDLLARALDLTDTDLHKRTVAIGQSISRTTINGKRTGLSPVRVQDLLPLAEALDVEVWVLLLKPSEALAWLAENRRDALDHVSARGHRRSRCTWPYSSRLTVAGTDRNNGSFAVRGVGASSNGVEVVACGVAHNPPLEGLFP